MGVLIQRTGMGVGTGMALALGVVLGGSPAARADQPAAGWAAGGAPGSASSSAPATPVVPPGRPSPGRPPIGLGPAPMAQRSADAQFIVMMIPHHQAAIAMADLARSRARDPRIRALAKGISSSQSRENELMRRWYGQWFGAAVPSWQGIGCGWGMGMGSGMGPGMPMGMGSGAAGSTSGLDLLRRAPDFDRAFLEQMVLHHRMGVMMALHAQWNSQHPELRELQAAMVRVQSREIEQMQQWYAQLYGSGGS